MLSLKFPARSEEATTGRPVSAGRSTMRALATPAPCSSTTRPVTETCPARFRLHAKKKTRPAICPRCNTLDTEYTSGWRASIRQTHHFVTNYTNNRRGAAVPGAENHRGVRRGQVSTDRKPGIAPAGLTLASSARLTSHHANLENSAGIHTARGERCPPASLMIGSRDNLALALDSIRAHKLRASLTVLGLTMGVATLITVMTLVQGANLYVETKVADLGTNVFRIARTPFAVTDFTVVTKALRNRHLYLDDMQTLIENCAHCLVVGATLSSSAGLKFKDKELEDATLYGHTPSMSSIDTRTVKVGRYFTEGEDR